MSLDFQCFTVLLKGRGKAQPRDGFGELVVNEASTRGSVHCCTPRLVKHVPPPHHAQSTAHSKSPQDLAGGGKSHTASMQVIIREVVPSPVHAAFTFAPRTSSSRTTSRWPFVSAEALAVQKQGRRWEHRRAARGSSEIDQLLQGSIGR